MGDLYTVYVHTAPNGKRYVGITSRKPEYRWRHGEGYYQNKHFSSAITKYGWDNFTHDIIVSGVSKETACEMEKTLIAEYMSNDPRFGYNNSCGGENPCQGHKATAEEIERRRKALTGRKMTEQGRMNISEAKKGKPNGKEGKFGKDGTNAVLVYQKDPNTGAVVGLFYGYNEMSRETGFAKTPVKEAAHGVRKQAYGYIWSFCKKGAK